MRHQRFTIYKWSIVAQLWRYGASNVGRTHGRTDAQVTIGYSVGQTIIQNYK